MLNHSMQAIQGGTAPLQEADPAHALDCEESAVALIPLRLVVQPSGPVLELTRRDMLMGRHSEADLRLPLPDISRRHCRFVFSDSAWQVFDLASLNGIFLNGKRVRQATLRDHDSLTIGSFRFTVELGSSTSDSSDSANAQQVIHRIADALPRTTPEIDGQRKAC